ncbi:MAG: hypothetical protein M3R54_00900 [Chloroflexota bacterium]|nr:hypothetical protein [Chloroflexota bacterium]
MTDLRRDVLSGATIGYRCAKPSHVAAPSRVGRGGLTVHRREWAYCDGLDVDEDHEWQETGGVEIEQLINWTQASIAPGAPF